MTISDQNLIWIDLEMTGLDPEAHKIIEIATIVTDAQLNVLAEGPVLAVHQPESELAKMDEWCTSTHTKSGLVARVRESKVDETEAVRQTIAFLEQWVPKGASPICGNSIGLPTAGKFFQCTDIQVTVVKVLLQLWTIFVIQSMSCVTIVNIFSKFDDDLDGRIEISIFFLGSIASV